MRLTIERMRTLVLVAGALLLAALVVFLVTAKWRGRFHRIDLPQRLAKEIQQESQNFDYTHNFGAHSKFRIHAAKAIQLRNDRIDLHGVEIELYGPNGNAADRISGDEFEYDQKSGVAKAAGPVEMLLTRPAGPASDGKGTARRHTPEAMARATGQVEVKTSGVVFDRNTGVVTTAQRVDFTVTQGSGSAIGAAFNSESGHLTLMGAVELTVDRGEDQVRIHADHAEFDRGAQLCLLRAASLEYRGGHAHAAEAKIGFREDGSAERLDASSGFVLTTATGGRLASPTAAMELDEHNQPRHARLEGGVTIDSKQEENSAQVTRLVHGTSPTAELSFNEKGQLRQAHLERGVSFESNEAGGGAAGASLRVSRTWRSPIADLAFRNVESAGKSQMEIETIHGAGGVVLASESRSGNAAAMHAKMQADEVTGTFGMESELRTVAGTGHAEVEQTTATGTVETASGNRVTASFAAPIQNRGQGTGIEDRKTGSGGEPQHSAVDVQSAELDGNVVLVERPAGKAGTEPQPPIRATAGKAVYEASGGWLHLTMAPRIVNGGLELRADKVDVSRQSDDAFAHGNVKATWIGNLPNGDGDRSDATPGKSERSRAGEESGAFGGKGPAHVIAAEAQFNEATGEAIFHGHARLWQEANSIAAPEIVLNQHLQTLTARTAEAGDPVRAVLLSVDAPGAGHSQGQRPRSGATKTSAPSVIRVSGGEFEYFDAEHRATIRGGAVGAVVAQTATAESSSDLLDISMIPAASSSGGPGQVDRMTATGHVALTAQGRRGSGERLDYFGVTGDYKLTGTAAAPPRITDPEQGSVTGEALIFHSRDDSVSIEGGGHETRTETSAPEAHVSGAGKPGREWKH